MVLRDENLPPLKWKLGRVVELHPGNDDLVRVVTVRTESGNFKRAIAKLCKLPASSSNDDKISVSNLVGGMFEANANLANCFIDGLSDAKTADSASGAA